MIKICIFVIHQNLIIMKPVLIIDDARAAILLRRLSEFIGVLASDQHLSLSSESVRSVLACILDLLSKSEDNETDRA